MKKPVSTTSLFDILSDVRGTKLTKIAQIVRVIDCVRCVFVHILRGVLCAFCRRATRSFCNHYVPSYRSRLKRSAIPRGAPTMPRPASQTSSPFTKVDLTL